MKLDKQKVPESLKRKILAKDVVFKLPLNKDGKPCIFKGYGVDTLMKGTLSLRRLIAKRGTLETLPLCCIPGLVGHLKFKNTLKGFSSKTLAIRLKNLERNGILIEKHTMKSHLG